MNEQLGISPKWLSGNQATPLTFGALHLWWLPLTLEADQHAQALELLNDIQRDKYHRRSTAEHREAYLAGRYYLMHLLGMYANTKSKNILLSYSRLNKPYLNPNPNGIHFNYTDTFADGQYRGLYAFCQGLEVGVDVEALNRSSDFEKIVARRFSNAEQEFVKDEQGAINPQRALAIWTRKEAYGKATGRGINFTMRDQDLNSHGDTTLNFTDQQQQNWRLTQMQLGTDYIASVVHQEHQELSLKAFDSAPSFA